MPHACVFAHALIAAVVAGTAIEGRLGDGVSAPLRAGFWSFDANGDGKVTLSELAVGIRASSERYEPEIAAHPFGDEQCADPTLDTLSFVECSVAKARRELMLGAASDLSVEFSASLESYVSGCKQPHRRWLAGECAGRCSQCAA